MTEVYEQRVFPVLTPLAVDPSHPFPYISDLALSVAAFVRDPETMERRFARVKVPDLLPRLVPIDDERFLPAEDLVIAHLESLFAGMIIEEAASFRVTRNADLTVEEEEADDLLEAVEMELRRRRFNRAVRLEVDDSISDEMLELLVRELDLHPNDVYRLRGTGRLLVPLAAPGARPARPQGPPVAADHAGAHRQRARGRASDRLGDARPGDPRCTTPTRASPRRPRRSSSRRRPIRGCSRSR